MNSAGEQSLPAVLAVVTDAGGASKEQGNFIVKDAASTSMSFWGSPFRCVYGTNRSKCCLPREDCIGRGVGCVAGSALVQVGLSTPRLALPSLLLWPGWLPVLTGGARIAIPQQEPLRHYRLNPWQPPLPTASSQPTCARV